MCGGTALLVDWDGDKSGLSPRVRGNPYKGIAGEIGIGSIPACAGEPGWNSAGYGKYEVYPRVCGGTRPRSRPSSHASGLSPRVRGNRYSPNWTIRSRRSIPACAGEPPADGDCENPLRVYPRVCGGTLLVGLIRPVDNGLSPRVRGNRADNDVERIPQGSIPACAGEPPPAPLPP